MDKQQESITEMTCPKCYSSNISVIGENRKDFSMKKGFIGGVLFGTTVGAILGS